MRLDDTAAPADPLPRIDRPDAGLVVVGKWTADTAQRQLAATEAAVAQWWQVRWPDGLLSHTAYASTDGATVLHYSQATGESAFQNVTRAKTEWVAGVDAAVPGIDRRDVTTYRLHRSVVPEVGSGDAGCIVVVTFETGSAEQATAWIAVLAEVGRDDAPAPGMLAAHFHVSTDGTRVLNYAEWVDVAAHQSSVQGRAERTDVVKIVDETPGVRFAGFKRYLWWRSATAPEV